MLVIPAEAGIQLIRINADSETEPEKVPDTFL